MKKPNYSLEELIFKLEEKLLQAEVRRSPDELDRLLGDEFIEYGSSGRVYDKEHVMRMLVEESGMEITLADFRARELAAGVILATYRSVTRHGRDGSHAYALRSSIWKRDAGRWRMIFHQGTPTNPP